MALAATISSVHGTIYTPPSLLQLTDAADQNILVPKNSKINFLNRLRNFQLGILEISAIHFGITLWEVLTRDDNFLNVSDKKAINRN